MSYTVYRHTCPEGKVYIGITARNPKKRFSSGYGHNVYMREALAKYGWDGFKTEILRTGLTRQEAEAEEVRLIAEHRSTDRRFGYNMESGGSGPGRMGKEARRTLSERMKGDGNPTRKYGHPMQGKHHTAESRLRMSISAHTRTRRETTDEMRANMRAAQVTRPVRETGSGREYNGIHEAAEATGLTATKICAVCKGKRKSTGGLHFEYIEED